MPDSEQNKSFLKEYFIRLRLLIVIIILMAVATVYDSHFLSFQNLSNILVQQASLGIVAVGMTFVILTGGIDLSVGSLMAVASVVTAKASLAGLPAPACLFLGLLTGLIGGFATGILVTGFDLSPFIATLAGMAAYKGLALVLSNSQPIRLDGKLFDILSNSRPNGIPTMIVCFFAVILIAWIILKHTVYGRHVYAIGSNSRAARTAGINVGATTLSVYVVSGLAAAMAAILVSGRLSSGGPTRGDLYEIDAIAAVIIGGASLNGGRGSVLGALGGVVILGIINNILNLAGVDAAMQRMARGAIIALAVILQSGGYHGVFTRLKQVFK